jgi:hypothetical protein
VLRRKKVHPRKMPRLRTLAQSIHKRPLRRALRLSPRPRLPRPSGR